MRPIHRGSTRKVYAEYEHAKQDLVNRLGPYCSYCERHIATSLHVEHIQAKGLPKYEHLRREWSNFLLACVNCNSAKGDTDVNLQALLLPDRDNTFLAFVYAEDGTVAVAPGLPPGVTDLANATCELVSLNLDRHPNWKEDLLYSALARVGQRIQAWVQAKEARADFDSGKVHARAIAREAAGRGFFSIWMAAFAGVPEVRRELIRVFPNTSSDCFDQDTDPVSPRPNNGLAHGGKI